MLRRLSLALICISSCAVAAELELLSRQRMASGHDRFGGLSGLEVIDNGTRALMLSDRGRIFEIALERSDEVAPTKVIPAHFVGWLGGDSEGLAIRDARHWFVSFEGDTRVELPWHACFAKHADFLEMSSNRGLEALAVDAEGRLVALPEEVVAPSGQFPIYRKKDLGWEIVARLAPIGGFVPVGADFGPDGRLYVLERQFGLFGFRTQIRRLYLDDEAEPELLMRSSAAEFDNLEGIGVWTDKQGDVRLTLVSDDNFLPFLRNELVEFRLNE